MTIPPPGRTEDRPEGTDDRPSVFRDLLRDRDVLVADGAMGTVLFDLGLESGGCPELLNVERPDFIAKVHQGYVEAGADILLTNTFGGNHYRLGLHDLADSVAELNAAAVRIATEVASAADRPVAVAGSIGPTGELFDPIGPVSQAEGVAAFREQAEALAEAGVDVLWIETLSAWEELEAALEATSDLGLPVSGTLSFDTNCHTMMGIAPGDFGRWWSTARTRPLALGANCGVSPSDNVFVAGAIASSAPGAVVVAKGNCGVPLYKEGALVYPSGPEAMGAYAELAVRSGAQIVGACCGSGFAHVAEIRAAVDRGIDGGPPHLKEIEERLGSSSSAVRRDAAPKRTRRRRAG